MATKQADPETRSKAFENELIEHMDTMYAVALRLTGNPADARDLQQEAIVRALRFHHKYEPGTYLRAWLLTILRNTFINNYRKRRRRPILVEWTGFEQSPEPPTDKEMGYYPEALRGENILEYLGDDLRDAVEALPEGHRQTVIMADLKDMSYKEIAEVLGCPLGTVMSRLHRGRRLLRENLAQHMREPAFG